MKCFNKIKISWWIAFLNCLLCILRLEVLRGFGGEANPVHLMKLSGCRITFALPVFTVSPALKWRHIALINGHKGCLGTLLSCVVHWNAFLYPSKVMLTTDTAAHTRNSICSRLSISMPAGFEGSLILRYFKNNNPGCSFFFVGNCFREPNNKAYGTLP